MRPPRNSTPQHTDSHPAPCHGIPMISYFLTRYNADNLGFDNRWLGNGQVAGADSFLSKIGGWSKKISKHIISQFKTGPDRARNTANILGDLLLFLGSLMYFRGLLIIPEWLILTPGHIAIIS